MSHPHSKGPFMEIFHLQHERGSSTQKDGTSTVPRSTRVVDRPAQPPFDDSNCLTRPACQSIGSTHAMPLPFSVLVLHLDTGGRAQTYIRWMMVQAREGSNSFQGDQTRPGSYSFGHKCPPDVNSCCSSELTKSQNRHGSTPSWSERFHAPSHLI